MAFTWHFFSSLVLACLVSPLMAFSSMVVLAKYIVYHMAFVQVGIDDILSLIVVAFS